METLLMATAAVVGAVLAVSATTAAVIAAAVNVALAFAAAYLMAQKYKSGSKGGTPSARDYSQLIKEDVVAQRVVYGRRQISMVMSFAEEESGTQDEGELLYMVGMMCNHPVSEIADFILDETLVSSISSGLVTHTHVNGTGVVPSWLISGTKNYTAEMNGSSGYWIALRLKFDTEQFTSVPTPKVTIKGKKVKDFRDGQIKYTANAALVIADFYLNYMNIPESRLLMSGAGSFIDAANLCDEYMDTGERRYEINGMFSLDQKPSEVLNEMLKSCGGTLIRQNGQIGLLPAAYYGPATFTVNESMVSGISISPEQPTSEAVNVMSGTYVSEDDEWAEQDFAPLKDEYAIDRDGQEINDDIAYNYVVNEMQAQRLANIELRRRTAATFIELKLSPLGAYCRIGRVVEIDLPQVGINGTFRVTGQTEDEDQGFTINLQRDELGIYDDAVGQPYIAPPVLSTGSNLTASPSGLQFSTVNDVGNEVQGALTWYASSASIDHFDVEVINTADDSLVQAGNTAALIFNLNALPLGNYKARVRSVNNRGATSTYATVTFSVGQPSIPNNIAVNRSNWNVEIIPNITGGVPQGTLFEFWYLADTASHITAPPSYDETSQGLSTLISTSTSLNKGSLTPDRWQHFWVRSINPYGKSGFVYVKSWTTKDTGLVTTVLEKLVAIEIESQNFDDDAGTGYKLFSPASDPYKMPDGSVLENPDGLLVANNAIIKGHVEADSGTFAGELKAASGTFSGDLEAAKGTFAGELKAAKGTFEGDITGANGTFEGTVRAKHIEGDILSGVSKYLGYVGNFSGTLVTYYIKASTTGLSRSLMVQPVRLKAHVTYESEGGGDENNQYYVSGIDWYIKINGSTRDSGSMGGYDLVRDQSDVEFETGLSTVPLPLSSCTVTISAYVSRGGSFSRLAQYNGAIVITNGTEITA